MKARLLEDYRGLPARSLMTVCLDRENEGQYFVTDHDTETGTIWTTVPADKVVLLYPSFCEELAESGMSLRGLARETCTPLRTLSRCKKFDHWPRTKSVLVRVAAALRIPMKALEP